MNEPAGGNFRRSEQGNQVTRRLFAAWIGLGGLFLCLSLSAMQVEDVRQPRDRVKAIEQAVEQSHSPKLPGGGDATFVVKGRFVAPDGEELPAGGATMVSRFKNRRATASLRLGPAGEFTRKIQASSTLFVQPRFPGYSHRCYGPFQVDDGPLDLGEVRLDRGFEARLLVQSTGGTPVAGVKIESALTRVTFGRVRSAINRSELIGLVSGEDGIIRLPHVTEELVQLTLIRAGYEHEAREIRLEKDFTLDWELTPAAPLTGRFVDGSGKPIEGVEIHLAHRDGPMSRTDDPRVEYLRQMQGAKKRRPPLASSHNEGFFRVESLRSDTQYWLMALHPGYRPVILKRASAGANLGEIRMEEPLVVRGTIKGDLSKLNSHSGKRYVAYENVMRSGDSTYEAGFETEVGDDGEFEITQLLAGNVRVWAAGQEKNVQVPDSVEDLTIDLDQPMARGNQGYRPLRLILRGIAGQPIRGEVRLTWRRTDKAHVGPRSSFKNLAASKIVEWESPPGADVWFSGSKLIGSMGKSRNLGRVPAGDGPYEMTVELEPAGLTSGRVIDDAGRAVRAYRIDVDRREGRRHEFLVHAVQVEHPNGKFAAGPLPLGPQHRYRTTIQVTDTWRVGMGEGFGVTDDAVVFSQTIQMPPVVTLSGRVLGADGKPASRARLRMTWLYETTSRSVGPSEWTDEDGRFRVAVSSGPLAGKYHFSIDPHETSAGRTFVFSADHYEADHDFGDIVLQPSTTVRGFVFGEDGRPQPNVQINLMPLDRDNAGYRESRRGRSDANGAFEITGVERIPQRLLVFGKDLVDATPPFVISLDALGNKRWAIEPLEADADATIIVK